jgi:dynein heavy chain
VQPWAEGALREVAQHTLRNDAEELQLGEDSLEKISEICLHFHRAVEEITEIYLKETGKHFYVTPVSYMKLLQNFRKMY